MKTLLAIAALAALAAPAAAKPHHHVDERPPFDFSGVWDSSYGDMSVEQTGAEFTASYPQNHGRIAAHVAGNVARGYWAQSMGAQRCSTMKLDSYYWGKIEFIAQPGGRRVEGSWSFCDRPLDAAWEGKAK